MRMMHMQKPKLDVCCREDLKAMKRRSPDCGHKWRTHLAGFILVLGVSLLGCGGRPTSSILDHSHDPAWLPFVPAPQIDSEVELDALWQGSSRCCGPSVSINNKRFYKACSNAIDRHPDNASLVVKCLWLMDIALEGEDAARLRQIVIDRYYDHKGSVAHCVNCAAGDIVARVAQDLSFDYERMRDAEAAARLLEGVLDRRGNEVSPWIKIEIHTRLCRLYLKTGIDAIRQQRVDAAYAMFDSMRAHETIARRFDEFAQACEIRNGPE
jgi:hypothetical protein